MRKVFFQMLLLLCSCTVFAQGVPPILNFSPSDYLGNNINFDIEIGADGTIFVANFEGVLYYDNVEWHVIHNPGITRITVVYRDKHDRIWVGGYNYFGRIQIRENGELYLQRIGKPDLFHGEVQEIMEDNDGLLVFLVNDGKLYQVKDDQVSVKMQFSENKLNIGLSDIIDQEAFEKDKQVVVLSDITQKEPLDNGLTAVVRKGSGIVITDESGREIIHITKSNGLCSDNVSYVAYDGHGSLWGAADDGIFKVAVSSAFSRFSITEGLTDGVISIEEYESRKYVGTNNGLFRQEGRMFVQVKGVSHACWGLASTQQGLLAATANGIYLVTADGVARQLTSASTTALLADGPLFYSGELDGVYLVRLSNSRKKICDLEKVTRILKDGQGTIWLQNVYGRIWKKGISEEQFSPYKKDGAEVALATLVMLGDKVEVVNAETTVPFDYPQFSNTDAYGVTWLTDSEGKSLYRWKDGKRLNDMDRLLYPYHETVIRAIYCDEDKIWLGGNHLWVIDRHADDPLLTVKPNLRFRQVTLGGDSILWGGFGEMPAELPELTYGDNMLRFTYALDYVLPVGTTAYRYRLNDGQWSSWADDRDVEFNNLHYGNYSLTVQARQATGELSECVTMKFSIAPPFYMRWYMLLLYVLIALLLTYALFRYRLHRLSQEKTKLEHIVQNRTAEVVRQKNEIEEKSKSLETALHELGKAQHELIRQEKMATVGKLTQGLIDRILNPLNYINNFSKLSEGLVKDIEANIEDDKDNMDSENYEDTMDVLGMLHGNLQKVSEHGQNTTRTLKAMEEMLKDRSGGIVPMDLVKVLHQDEEMLQTYYADDIRQYGIKTVFDIPQDSIAINGNADQLSKTLMSILGNAVYAVVKRAQRENYQPELSLSVNTIDTSINIVIRDNGIGIEPTIIGKIFDPFFTTKTTGEAAGVGLYLSHEIIQNHGGTISVKSEKNVYTEFIITLPIS